MGPIGPMGPIGQMGRMGPMRERWISLIPLLTSHQSPPPFTSPITSHHLPLTVAGVPGVPGVTNAAAAFAAQLPLRDIQSDLEERPLLEAHPRLGPTVQLFAPALLDRRLPRSA
jgi:hypothetical protein